MKNIKIVGHYLLGFINILYLENGLIVHSGRETQITVTDGKKMEI